MNDQTITTIDRGRDGGDETAAVTLRRNEDGSVTVERVLVTVPATTSPQPISKKST